jgi:predicted DNA-binding ribbon-helix-helix protein
LLNRKYSLEKYYKELIKTAEDRKCVSVDLITKINQEYKSLRTEEIGNLEANLPFYSRSSYQHEVDIEK